MPQAVRRQKDIVILQKGNLRLRRILFSAIANTIASEYDVARICLGTFQPQSPDSLIHHFTGCLLVPGVMGSVADACATDVPSATDAWKGGMEAWAKKDLACSLALETWVQGVRLWKQKHLWKDQEPLFHVPFISMGQRRGRHLYCRRHWRVTLGERQAYSFIKFWVCSRHRGTWQNKMDRVCEMWSFLFGQKTFFK